MFQCFICDLCIINWDDTISIKKQYVNLNLTRIFASNLKKIQRTMEFKRKYNSSTINKTLPQSNINHPKSSLHAKNESHRLVPKINTVFFINWHRLENRNIHHPEANYPVGYKKWRTNIFRVLPALRRLDRAQSSWLKVETRESGSCRFLRGLRKAGRPEKQRTNRLP